MIRKYFLFLLLLIGCTGPSEKQQVKVFLTEWSKSLIAKEQSVRRFYDLQFAFPTVIFDAGEEVHYSFDLEHIKISSATVVGDMEVTVPFQVADHDGVNTEYGNLLLTITKTENGFVIRDMSQELAVMIKQHSIRLQLANNPSEFNLRYDSLLAGVRASADALAKQYDSVAFYTEVDDQLLFYVIKGSWEYPYTYEREKQRDAGNYKIGVVTAENKVVIPVEFTKIYNPDGSFEGMIEVESDGLRGLYHTTGGAFIPAEFEGIYPTTAEGVFAQVKKGDRYGWVSATGMVSFEPSSHLNKKLFQSPIETNAILEWEFKFPGPIKLLVNPYDFADELNGVLIYPSYLRDLGITPIANSFVFLESSTFGMGMTDSEIKFEKVESLADKFFGLVSFFMEAGADARGYHFAQNDLLVLDKSMNRLGYQESITYNTNYQNPCGKSVDSYRTIEPGLYEAENENGFYEYYKITEGGTVQELKTNRQYNFTKFVKIDKHYFDRCHFKEIDYDESLPANVILYRGLSSEDLDIMRNEIFAEYGFIFKTPKWKEYFGKMPWYQPQFDNVDHLLTDIDKANIKFILEYQSQHKDMKVQSDSIMFGWAG